LDQISCFLPKASLRPQSACLWFPCSWDYRCELPCLARIIFGGMVSLGSLGCPQTSYSPQRHEEGWGEVAVYTCK
jgi:hypothetical protein